MINKNIYAVILFSFCFFKSAYSSCSASFEGELQMRTGSWQQTPYARLMHDLGGVSGREMEIIREQSRLFGRAPQANDLKKTLLADVWLADVRVKAQEEQSQKVLAMVDQFYCEQRSAGGSCKQEVSLIFCCDTSKSVKKKLRDVVETLNLQHAIRARFGGDMSDSEIEKLQKDFEITTLGKLYDFEAILVAGLDNGVELLSRYDWVSQQIFRERKAFFEAHKVTKVGKNHSRNKLRATTQQNARMNMQPKQQKKHNKGLNTAGRRY